MMLSCSLQASICRRVVTRDHSRGGCQVSGTGAVRSIARHRQPPPWGTRASGLPSHTTQRRRGIKGNAQRPGPARGPAAVGDKQPSEEEAEEAAEEEGGEEEEEEDASGELPELIQARHIIVEEGFLEDPDQLRSVFAERFEDPRKTSRSRFLWDWWHVPNQYTLVRTQAQAYFPSLLYEQLVESLITYGETKLGCRAISPIWMSYYIDGCSQDLHCDSYHGPFAFVLSLTPWEQRRFTGGETMILQPQVLNFWEAFDPTRGLELTDLVTLVPPRYNQLTVFDPRFPHGVRAVSGTKDPLEARLVLHGWFTDPSPFFDGPLDEQEAMDALNTALEPLLEALGDLPPVLGTLSLRFKVSGSDGSVSDVEFLADTLVVLPQGWTGQGYGEEGLSAAGVRAAVQHTAKEHMLDASFPTCKEGDTLITLPLVFE